MKVVFVNKHRVRRLGKTGPRWRRCDSNDAAIVAHSFLRDRPPKRFIKLCAFDQDRLKDEYAFLVEFQLRHSSFEEEKD